MKKVVLIALAGAGLFIVALPLHAQSGCTDSPENSTVVLALVGSASALFASVRAHAKKRNKTRDV